MSREGVVLAPESVDAIVRALAPIVERAVERVVTESLDRQSPRRYVDAATLAEALGLARDTVYRRAEELGGVKILTGDKGKARWRFDLDRALRESLRPEPPARPPRRRRLTAAPDVHLLPIGGGAT